MGDVSLRPAVAEDGPFLAEMLVEASHWPPDGVPASVPAMWARPDLAHYIAGWPRPGDTGVVAVSEGRPVGACWLRLFPATDPGYGFVDAATPELAIAAVESFRGRGVGLRLMRAVIEQAAADGVPALSLSVWRHNPALRLYEYLGFRTVGGGADDLRMLLRL